MLKSANLAVKFVLELAAFAALAHWVASTGHGALSVVLAIAAPLAAVIGWSVYCAPRARRRLPAPAWAPLEPPCSGSTLPAIIFGIVVVLNSALRTVVHQWEE